MAADEGYGGLVIKVQNANFKMQKDPPAGGAKCKIECEAGVSLGKIILETSKNGYSGVEWGFGIPGTIGGAIFGNAGRLGQAVYQVVRSVTILDKNLNETELSVDECEFAYRESRFKKTGEIILEAVLEFKKNEPAAIAQVLNEAKEVIKNSPPFPSAGCVFKNYQIEEESDPLLLNHPELNGRVRGGKIGVGHLIDRCGLLGRQINGAKIWESHANYIVNTGGAKAKDVFELIKICKEKVREKYGLELDEELRYLKME